MFAAAIAAVGVVGGLIQGKKAQDQSKEARQNQAAIARIRNEQVRRASMEEFRAAQAQAVLGTLAGGAGLESSRTMGQLTSNRTQQTTRLSELERQTELGDAVIRNQDRQAQANFYGSLYNTAANLVVQDGVRDFVNNLGKRLTGG